MSKLTGPPSGTRDFVGEGEVLRQQLVGHIAKVFEGHGFEPWSTPAMERLSVLLDKYGDEGDQLIFKILRRGKHEASGATDLGLRYDLTVPLARVISNKPPPKGDIVKRYQIGPVWRADRPGRGRFREFYQCDVDIVGAAGPAADADILEVALDSLRCVGFDDVTLLIGARPLLFGLLECHGVDRARYPEAIRVLDKLDKLGAEGVLAALVEGGFVPEGKFDDLATALRSGSTDAWLPRYRRESKSVDEGLELIEAVLDQLDPDARAAVRVAPFLARGLDYYTGVVFEAVSPRAHGTIAAGGRYDGLVGALGGAGMPACGGSLGFERLLDIALQTGRGAAYSRVDVVVAHTAASRPLLAKRACRALRAAGLRAETFLGDGALAKQLRHTDRIRAPICVIVGLNEPHGITVRDMATGEQVDSSEAALAGDVHRLLARE